MTVFKYFWRIMWTYKIGILLYFGIFSFISLMSAQRSDTAEYRHVMAQVAVVDEDQSALSKHLYAYLAENNQMVPAPEKKDIDEQVFMGMADLIVFIPKGFEADPLSARPELNKNYLSEKSHKVIQEIAGYLLLMQISREPDGGMNYDLFDKSLAQKAEVELVGKAESDFQKEEWIKRYVNASAYPIIALVIFSIGMGMADFNNKRIAFRNKCSGYSLRRFQGQMYLAQLLFGTGLWVWILLLGIVLSGGIHGTQILSMYGLNIAVFTLTIMSFGFFLNNVVKNKNALSAIANIVALGSSFVCGVFIPLEYLGGFAIRVARFLPAYYYVLANESLYAGNSEWMANMAIQLLFAAVFILAGFYVAGVRQRESALEM